MPHCAGAAGLAQRLIDAAEEFARAQGGTRMKLWSDTRFDRAHRFYEKRSYVRSGPLKVHNDLSNSIEFAYAKPLAGVMIERLDAAGAASAEARLAEVLRACVDAGALGVVHAATGTRGGRRVSGGAKPPKWHRASGCCWRPGGGVLAGTAMLDIDMPPNQPHRADVQKVAGCIQTRGGVAWARALMDAIEAEARLERRDLLVLDTKEGDAAEMLYRTNRLAGGGADPGLRAERRRDARRDDPVLEDV